VKLKMAKRILPQLFWLKASGELEELSEDNYNHQYRIRLEGRNSPMLIRIWTDEMEIVKRESIITLSFKQFASLAKYLGYR